MPFLADCWQDLKKGQALGLALDSGVTLVEADVLKPEQLAAALVGVQAVICATGYTGFNPGGRVKGEEVWRVWRAGRRGETRCTQVNFRAVQGFICSHHN